MHFRSDTSFYVSKVLYKRYAPNAIVITKLSHFCLIGCQRGLQRNWLHFIGQADGQHSWEDSVRRYLLTTCTEFHTNTHIHMNRARGELPNA